MKGKEKENGQKIQWEYNFILITGCVYKLLLSLENGFLALAFHSLLSFPPPKKDASGLDDVHNSIIL